VATAISMPKLGMTMEEGTVIQWPLSLGDRVEKGRLVLVIESEKNEADVEAPAAGFLRHVYVEEGETVPCGTLLGAITETADEAFDHDAFHAAENHPEQKAGGALQVRGAAAPPPGCAAPAARTDKPVAPAARAAARKLGVDPQAVPGTGPGGRVTRQDVEAWAAVREALVPVAEGVALEVLTLGDGDLVVLLPGLGTDVSAFARQTPVLAEHFRVHGVNPRGVGLSDGPAADAYDVAQTAADAAATYEGAAHVVGASLGAAAALELALGHPGRVKSLTLITPFTRATARLEAIGEGWRRMAAEAAPETLAAALLPWFFSSGFLADDAARGRTLRGLAQSVARVPAATLDRMCAGMHRWSGTRAGDLEKISVRTLVVAAGDDLLAPDAEAVAAAIPGARLLVVEGAGHAVALEAPDAVNEAITAHLG
jgi:pyruvate/2-oxoglutarate dehydrogenase complex dihydrolipoamide acyltransferase (E2) component